MIKGIGIDIVEIERIASLYKMYPTRFIQKILHATEQEFLNNTNVIQYLASRFAVKEATVKALGTGFSEGISFKDITLIPLENGKPSLILYGKALLLFNEMKANLLHISLSHEKRYSVATVILE